MKLVWQYYDTVAPGGSPEELITVHVPGCPRIDSNASLEDVEAESAEELISEWSKREEEDNGEPPPAGLVTACECTKKGT